MVSISMGEIRNWIVDPSGRVALQCPSTAQASSAEGPW